MDVPRSGSLPTYNSLTDKHLIGYFRNARIRQHLRRAGLLSSSGRIIPEKEYKLNALKKDRQCYIQEYLARAIFNKILDMERHHQLERKRETENSMRKEKAQKVKVEQSRRSVEGAIPTHIPRLPPGPQNRYKPSPFLRGEAAGLPQRRAYMPVVGNNSGQPSHQHQTKEPALSKLGERSGLRLSKSAETGTGTTLCELPVLCNYAMPVPPPPGQKGNKSINAVRGRRFRPVPDIRQLLTKNSGGFPRPSIHTSVAVTMVFLGKKLRLSRGHPDYRDDIKIHQQHCGGENLCVYKGKLLEGETFQFVSKRHPGFPFSLTFFLNGMQVDRLSCCCEYKLHKRTRLGGRRGYFGFLNVEGASPCFRCIIAMCLDKIPSSPERKMENHEEKHVASWRDEVQSEPSKSSVEQKASKSSLLVILPRCQESVETSEDKTETEHEYRKEEKTICDCEREDSQEDTSKNEYNEDFEEDEEGSQEERTGDEMNGMSKSSSADKSHNTDDEKESRNSPFDLQTSEGERDEIAEYSDAASEDDKQGPDGALLAEGTPEVQMEAEQVVGEEQIAEERGAPEKQEYVAEGGDARVEEAGEEMARAGDFLPKEDTMAVLQTESPLGVEECAPEETAMAEEGAKGTGARKGKKSHREVACEEQQVVMEGAESEAALGVQAFPSEERTETLLGGEADGAVSEGEEVAVEMSEGEEAAEEACEAKEAVGAVGPLAEEVVGGTVSEAEETVEEGGSAEKDLVGGAVSEGEEAVEDAQLAGQGIARVFGPEGDKAVEETISEGEEAMEKPWTLLEALEEKNIHTGEAMLKEEDFIKPNEFYQLKAEEEEQMKMGKATAGAATSACFSQDTEKYWTD